MKIDKKYIKELGNNKRLQHAWTLYNKDLDKLNQLNN